MVGGRSRKATDNPNAILIKLKQVRAQAGLRFEHRRRSTAEKSDAEPQILILVLRAGRCGPWNPHGNQ